MSTGILALAFERPWALALLALPIVLYVLAQRRREHRAVATSDLELWRASDEHGAASRPRLPRRTAPALVLALAALAAGALAIAGPRRDADRPQWTCVLDTSASMSLLEGGSSRRERAIASAIELAARHGAELRWIAPAFRAESFDSPSRAWPADGIARPTSFASWDVPGALWITDAKPQENPRFAGVSASGGGAVPGPVAVEGADRIDWDGARLVRVPGAALARAVGVAGLDVRATAAGPLARVLAAWIAARGVIAEPDESADRALVLRVVVSAGERQRDVRTGRDGWTATGPVLGAVRLDRDEDAGLEPWIVDGRDVLVARGPGRVEVAWLPGEPDDAAAFAVSWAELFDACALAPPGVVPLDERVAAGEPSVSVPARAGRGEAASATWILGALAALLALGALLARRA